MSRVLVFGSRGFIGRHVADELSSGHDVYRASRTTTNQREISGLKIDLLNQDDVHESLCAIRPDIVINCAGVVDPSDNVENNVVYTTNIIRGIARAGLKSPVIISGSAGSYGQLASETELPVKETTPLRADRGYALAKKKEEEEALMLAEQLNIPVVVLRVFNPIGVGMADKFLIPRVLNQIEEMRQELRDTIEVSRLDSKRDYIAIEDVARAFRAVVEGDPSHSVYNVGSGTATTNDNLLRLLIKSSKIDFIEPRIVETQSQPEPLVANQADIRRMNTDFGWIPRESLGSVIERIVSEQTN